MLLTPYTVVSCEKLERAYFHGFTKGITKIRDNTAIAYNILSILLFDAAACHGKSIRPRVLCMQISAISPPSAILELIWLLGE